MTSLPTSAAYDALQSVADAAGVIYDSRDLHLALERAVLDLPGDWPSTWLDRLGAAGAAISLNCSRKTGTLLDVLQFARLGAPVVIFATVDSPAAGFLTVFDRRAKKVLVGRDGQPASWISVRKLVRELSLSRPLPEMECLALEPAAPYSSATLSNSSRDTHQEDSAGSHAEHALPPLRRLVRILQLDMRDLAVILVFAIGVGILSLATPIAVELLVNSIAFGSLVQPVLVLSLILFICLAFVAGMQLIQTVVVESIQRRLFVRCVADLAYRLPRVQLAAYDRHYGPEIVNRFLDVAIFQKALATLLLDGLFIVLQASVGMLVLAAYHPYLLGYDVVLLAMIAGIVFVLGRGATGTAVEESRAKYDTAAQLQELSRLPISIKLRGGPTQAIQTADHFAKRYLNARTAHFRILLRQIIASYGLQVISSTVLLGLGGWLVIQRELTLGQLVAAELIVGNIARAFAKGGKYFESFYDLLAATDKLGHLFDLPQERRSGEVMPTAQAAMAVEIRDLSFRFPEGRNLFEALNAVLPPRSVTAVIGSSGSGKTTLLELLYGARIPSSGYIKCDSVDLRQLDLAKLRNEVALVQQPDILAGTILDNVRWGRADLTVTEVNGALSAVGLLDTVLQLPAGLHTNLTQTGKPLSSSQVLAIVMARALVGRPRLLLIDGFLDGMAEELRSQVIEFILSPTATWTVVLVSNDSSIRGRCGQSIELTSTEATDLAA